MRLVQIQILRLAAAQAALGQIPALAGACLETTPPRRAIQGSEGLVVAVRTQAEASSVEAISLRSAPSNPRLVVVFSEAAPAILEHPTIKPQVVSVLLHPVPH